MEVLGVLIPGAGMSVNLRPRHGNTDPLESEHCLGRRAITLLGVSRQERRSPLKKLRVGSGVLLVTARLKLSVLAF